MGWVVAILLGMLRNQRARTYTPEQLDAIARARSQEEVQQGLPPALKAPRRPYRWWRYEGLL